jgi:hypothetical protein
MSQSQKRSRRTPLWRRFRYLLMFLSGAAGVGGWQLKDHPLLQGIFQQVVEANPDGVPLQGELMRVAAKALTSHESFREPGTFEVKVSTVKLDPGLFKAGHTVDIAVRVRKIDAQGHDSVVWESKNYGERLTLIGRDELAAGWANRPFQVDWTPGDRFSVDVWDAKALLLAKQFEMEPSQDGTFPLQTGTHGLTLVEWGRHTQRAEVNQIVFESHRISGADGPRTAEKSRPAAGPRPAAAAAAAGRDDDTIVIK